ncbi:hypothetical protein PDIG_69310 [Penicillium digitatum PHI26]|uniref:Uncharacterized protein n=2 Tax=Penicillium digitatum TaxID=36651 RepID=K9G4H4_PEND2|nr:hypothetical protein PDIP_78600 [Penicillium digitatum Pd1]EKV06599.1 hypothetical protein PDIP_78600 [Penicillium digitatum Pd1]EKV08166.1 hypothetical protein PDIG_69310 [Penicillium digitatum PHI26]
MFALASVSNFQIYVTRLIWLNQEKTGYRDPEKSHDCQMFHDLRLSDVRDHVGHSCDFTQHPLLKIQMMTILWIDDPTPPLRVLTSYAIRGSKCVLPQIPRKPKALAERDIAKGLRKIFADAGSAFSGWHKKTAISWYL